MTTFIYFWDLIYTWSETNNLTDDAIFNMMEFLSALRLKIKNPEALVGRVILREGA